MSAYRKQLFGIWAYTLTAWAVAAGVLIYNHHFLISQPFSPAQRQHSEQFTYAIVALFVLLNGFRTMTRLRQLRRGMRAKHS